MILQESKSKLTNPTYMRTANPDFQVLSGRFDSFATVCRTRNILQRDHNIHYDIPLLRVFIPFYGMCVMHCPFGAFEDPLISEECPSSA